MVGDNSTQIDGNADETPIHYRARFLGSHSPAGPVRKSTRFISRATVPR